MSAPRNIKFHEVTKLFPLDVDSDDFATFVDDIRENGLRVPLIRFDGKLIDGRRRALACQQLGIEPAFADWDGPESDLVPYVVSLNVFRRHLTASQRAMIAVRLLPEFERQAAERQKRGQTLHANSGKVSGEAADLAGQMVNVSGDTVRRAKAVVGSAPVLASAVTDGVLSVHDAAGIAEQPRNVQEHAIELVRTGQARNARAAVKQLEAGSDRQAASPAGPSVLKASELVQAGRTLQAVGESLVVAAGSLTAQQIGSLKIVHGKVNVFDAVTCLRSFLEHVADQITKETKHA